MSRLLHRRRRYMDTAVRVVVSVGGVGIILSVALIFVFLVVMVYPLFRPATVQLSATYPVPGPTTASLGYILDEHQRVGVRIDAEGTATLFAPATGREYRRYPAAAPAQVHSFALGEAASRVYGLGFGEGTAVLVRAEFSVSYPQGRMQVRGALHYPLGAEPLRVDPAGQALTRLAVQLDEDRAGILAWTADGRLLLLQLSLAENGAGELEIEEQRLHTLYTGPPAALTRLALEPRLWNAFAAHADGSVHYYDIAADPPQLVQAVPVVSPGAHITAMRLLSGGVSLLVGDSTGQVAQWAPVQEPHKTLARLRVFAAQSGPVEALAVEYYRKGFMVAAGGVATLYSATANRQLYSMSLAAPLRALHFAPRADAVLYEDSRANVHLARIHNPHPEFSLAAVWKSIWYEGRNRPARVWQSSSASDDFEPKFGLAPLAFGTLKAALYAMLFAIPLAVFGAAYTAYFMHPSLRALVKPSIEIMEALPTVILGFLAGIWFAPLVERNLPGILGMVIVLPLLVLAVAALWPAWRRNPTGREVVWLIPVLVAGGMLSLWLGNGIEAAFFDDNLPLWLYNELGIRYEQRNSLVVGIAMGFAVIPTIFSVSEDAIYGVPRHLASGSLALGASQWQTLLRLVLLTASPGILSAVMIGMGRAVGETMIVIMATGNTPIIDLNIFQGFRAMSANIAVEMPEAEVNSTHYRILFMAALLLFIVTFAFNTLAEAIRRRLRYQYSRL